MHTNYSREYGIYYLACGGLTIQNVVDVPCGTAAGSSYNATCVDNAFMYGTTNTWMVGTKIKTVSKYRCSLLS